MNIGSFYYILLKLNAETSQFLMNVPNQFQITLHYYNKYISNFSICVNPLLWYYDFILTCIILIGVLTNLPLILVGNFIFEYFRI